MNDHLNATIQAINWNRIPDPKDQEVWDRLTGNFWLPEKIPLSNDIQSWSRRSEEEQTMAMHVFTGLTLLDTLQSEAGLTALKQDVKTPHETAVLNNIQFMESVHAKSYSTIFSTLNTPDEIEEIFHWSDTEEYLQNKAVKIGNMYLDPNEDPLKKKICNVFLETFLFYSGFYTPLYYLGHNKLNNVAEIIKLILRDESVHGTYIGYKFQVGMRQLSEKRQQDIKDWMYSFLYELYDNEEKYTHLLYDQVGWTDDVLTFIRYNANKALMNLGQDPLFPDTDEDVNPVVMNGISTTTSNHDFFSQVGNGYRLGAVEAMNDRDYHVADPNAGKDINAKD